MGLGSAHEAGVDVDARVVAASASVRVLGDAAAERPVLLGHLDQRDHHVVDVDADALVQTVGDRPVQGLLHLQGAALVQGDLDDQGRRRPVEQVVRVHDQVAGGVFGHHDEPVVGRDVGGGHHRLVHDVGDRGALVGAAFATLIADLKSADDAGLKTLIDACESVGRRLQTADMDDRNAASYPFLTMLSVATCGWLIEREAAATTGDTAFDRMKRAVCAFYLTQIVPEALGLRGAADAPAAPLYTLSVEELAA